MAETALTHPGRVYYPDDGITKADVRDFYRAMADRILPHAAGRPLSLVRCPGGIGESCFFQKHPGEGMPEALKPVPVREKDGGLADYMTVEDADGLEALAQIGALEIHPWGAKTDDIERPERIIFDLDPDAGLDFADVKAAARTVRELLEASGLAPFALLTGGKGVHVIAPLKPKADWEMVKDFCRTLAKTLAAERPDRDAASGHLVVEVEEEEPHAFAESERRDDEHQPLDAQRGKPYGGGADRAEEARGAERRHDVPAGQHRKHSCAIGPDGEEGGLRHAHLPGEDDDIGGKTEERMHPHDLRQTEVELHD
jgi:DNA ligase D-like protein (predicted polymerase)